MGSSCLARVLPEGSMCQVSTFFKKPRWLNQGGHQGFMNYILGPVPFLIDDNDIRPFNNKRSFKLISGCRDSLFQKRTLVGHGG